MGAGLQTLPPMTDQQPVSVIGWGFALAAGALLWFLLMALFA